MISLTESLKVGVSGWKAFDITRPYSLLIVTIQTGLMTAIWAIINLILYLAMPQG